MSATSDHITAITREVILPGLQDNYFSGSPTWKWMWERRKTLDGGYTIDWTFNDTRSYNAQNVNYFQQYLVKPPSFAKRASIDFVDKVAPVTLSKTEIKKITGETGLINYVEDTMKRELMSFDKMMSAELFGSGRSTAHPIFNALPAQTPIAGLDLIVAAGRTYAGHDSTSNALLDSYVKTINPTEFADLYDPAAASFLPDAMTEVLNETEHFQGESVDWISTTKIMREALQRAGYREAVSGVIIKQDGSRYDLGVKAITFEGIPVVKDWDCGAGKMYCLESNTLYIACLKGAEMTFEDFQDNSGGDAIVANWKLSCQVICLEPRRQGKITGGSSTRT